MKTYKVLSGYGPGGRNCPCCGPGIKERKTVDRYIRRRERGIMKGQIRNEVKWISRDIL